MGKLMLKRRINEGVVIEVPASAEKTTIRVSVGEKSDVKSGFAVLAFEAPQEVLITREELKDDF